MPDSIFDTTTLSNFAAAGRLELLEDRYRGRALTSPEVSDEVRRGFSAGYAYLEPLLQAFDSIDPRGWLHILVSISLEEQRLRTEFDQLLDPGEASCLALAVSRKLIFVTDDLAARRLVAERGVRLSGTLGILLALVRDNTLPLPEANAILTSMIRRRYRSPVDRLDGLV